MSAVAERDSDKDGWLPAACDLSLAPRSASLEVALFDIASEAATPHRLTQLIEAGFAAPSGQPANWAARMSVIDRQIALFRLALSLGAWPAWFVARCECCGKPIDIRAAVDEFTITPGPPCPPPSGLKRVGQARASPSPPPATKMRCSAATRPLPRSALNSRRSIPRPSRPPSNTSWPPFCPA